MSYDSKLVFWYRSKTWACYYGSRLATINEYIGYKFNFNEEVSCDEWYITNHVRNNAVDNIVGALPLDCHRI